MIAATKAEANEVSNERETTRSEEARRVLRPASLPSLRDSQPGCPALEHQLDANGDKLAVHSSRAPQVYRGHAGDVTAGPVQVVP